MTFVYLFPTSIMKCIYFLPLIWKSKKYEEKISKFNCICFEYDGLKVVSHVIHAKGRELNKTRGIRRMKIDIATVPVKMNIS